MKLRYLATVVLLVLTTVAAHAQSQNDQSQSQAGVGLYFNPLAIRVSNSVQDSGPYAFFGPNATSAVFYGFDLGGFYDFFHSGKIDGGLDLRFSDLHANHAALKTYLIGLRVSAHPFARPFKPYLEASIGRGTTKPPSATVEVKKVDYGVFAGVDYTFHRHVDFRVAEIGYGSLITASSADIGNGGSFAVPASKLITFSSGLVFRF